MSTTELELEAVMEPALKCLPCELKILKMPNGEYLYKYDSSISPSPDLVTPEALEEAYESRRCSLCDGPMTEVTT